MASRYDRFWLQADIQSPEIDFRCTPNSGHSEAHAGLLLVTRSGPKVGSRSGGWNRPSTDSRMSFLKADIRLASSQLGGIQH